MLLDTGCRMAQMSLFFCDLPALSFSLCKCAVREDSLPGATVFRSFRPIQRYFVGTRRSKAASRVSIVAEQSAHLDHRGALVEIDALLCPLLLYEISNCLSRLVPKNKTDAIVAREKAEIQPRQWAPR